MHWVKYFNHIVEVEAGLTKKSLK